MPRPASTDGLIRALVPLLAIALPLWGCSGNSGSGTDPGGEDDLLAEVTVGPVGGDVTAEGFVCEIPAGALLAPADLRLFARTEGHPFAGTESAGPLYRLEGLPAARVGALTFRIRLASGVRQDGEPATRTLEGLIGLVGTPGFAPSRGAERIAWNPTAATLDGGWAVFVLAPPEAGVEADSGEAARTDEARPDPELDSLPLTVGVAIAAGAHETAAGHFVVHYPGGSVTQEQAVAVGTHLENAFQIVDELGFQAARAWPVTCTILTLSGDAGGFTPSLRGADHGTIDLEARLLGDSDALAVTCGHEVFHLFQYFYDPRPEPARARSGGDAYGLNEATSVWSEFLFTPVDPHLPAERAASVAAPIAGIFPDEEIYHHGLHGHGMSALLNYLFDVAQVEPGILVAVYEAIRAGQHPVVALDEQIPDSLAERWVPFLRLLLAGGLYGDFTGAVATDARADSVEIRSEAFDTAHLGTTLADLGSVLYAVRLERGEIPANSYLSVRSSAGDIHLSAFSHAGPEVMELVATGVDSLVIDNLSDLADQDRHLMILVTSTIMEGPLFDDARAVTTTLEMRERLDVATVNAGEVDLDFVANWGGGHVVPSQELQLHGHGGTYAEGTFQATWDATGPDGWRRYGYFTVILEPASGALLTWAAEEREDNAGLDIQRISRASGGPAPVEALDSGAVSWGVSGVSAAASVDFIFISEIVGGNVTRFLQGFAFNDETSFFTLRLTTDD